MGSLLLLPRVPFPLRAPIPKPLLLSNSPPLCEPTPPPRVPAQGGRGHLLRDTWMSSVTLNTPEVTKLSWKSVVSGKERKDGGQQAAS